MMVDHLILEVFTAVKTGRKLFGFEHKKSETQRCSAFTIPNMMCVSLRLETDQCCIVIFFSCEPELVVTRSI